MKTINNNAPVKYSKRITINAPVEKVWNILADIDNWKDWQTSVTNSKINGELKPGTTFNWKSNGLKIHSTLHTVEPLEYIGWTGKSLGSFAVHNWTLKDINGKTEVLVEESMEGFLVGLLRKTFNKVLKKGVMVSLEQLKYISEKEIV